MFVDEEQGVTVLDPETGEFVAEIDVEGAPDKMFFHEEGGTVYGFTANTQNDMAAVVDFDQPEVVGEVEVGGIARPEGAERLHRGGLAVLAIVAVYGWGWGELSGMTPYLVGIFPVLLATGWAGYERI